MQTNRLNSHRDYGGYYPSINPVKTMDKKKLVLIIVGTVVMILFIAFIILEENTPRNYYMKDLFVTQATIVQSSDDDGYAVQVRFDNPPKSISIDDDNTWVTVDSQFYSAHSIGQQIGVLVCNYDVMKENNFGLFGKDGQTFEKELWSVDSAYNSYSDAQAAYPHREFKANATLKSKIKLSDGELYDVMDYDGREMTVRVSEQTYTAYRTGESVPCNFDGYGDFVKIVSISS